MNQAYRTILDEARAETVVKKSRFLGQLAPARSPEEARAFVSLTKTAHWDASHNVWAYSLREGQLRRYSDDGEPQGTAGLPALEVLLREELTDCVVVITRYFGGILLGASGLTRAYAQSAKAAVDAARIVTMAHCQTLRVRCDYGFYGRLAALVPACGGTVLDTDFAGEVTLTLRLRSELAASFHARLTDASHGKYTAQFIDEGFHADR
ncbi:MAG: IMPACT family protein [Oscillospiraceae bacterium]|nr:IMPACT family protein [Oscillospiraceae bacterium]